MESEQEHVFRRYQAELDAYIDSCAVAVEMLEDSRGLIKEMEANYRFVEENSKALQIACEAMLEEQVGNVLQNNHTSKGPGAKAHAVHTPFLGFLAA